MKRTILLVSFLLVVGSAMGANAQSTDRDNPTPLASAEIEGAGVEQKTVYYYTFEGGPGKISATLEATTKKGAKSASVGIDLFDANAKSLTSTLLEDGLGGGKEKLNELLGNGLGRLTSGLDSLTGDTRHKTSSVKLKEKQKLTLRVTVDQGIKTYTVKLEGAVEFGQSATGSDPAQSGSSATESPTADSTVPPTDQQPQSSEQPQSTEPPPPTEQAPSAEQPTAPKQKPAIVKIPGKSPQPGQKPAIIKIPGRKPPQ